MDPDGTSGPIGKVDGGDGRSVLHLDGGDGCLGDVFRDAINGQVPPGQVRHIIVFVLADYLFSERDCRNRRRLGDVRIGQIPVVGLCRQLSIAACRSGLRVSNRQLCNIIGICAGRSKNGGNEIPFLPVCGHAVIDRPGLGRHKDELDGRAFLDEGLGLLDTRNC